MRILLDPDPTGTGGAEPAPAPAPAPAPVPTPEPPRPAPKVPEPAPTITLSKDEYHRLQGMERTLGEFQAERDRKIELAEQARIKAIADKEGVEKGLAEANARWEAKLADERAERAKVERQFFDEKRATVISDSMAGYAFVSPGAERQARAILEAEFETVRDGSGSLVIRDRVSGRPAADVVKERLDSADFSHFLKPATPGGSGTKGTANRTPTPKQDEPDEPANLGEALINVFKARGNGAAVTMPYGTPRTGL